MNLERGDLMIQFANAFSIAITFARWRQRSEATTVPYGANLYYVTFTGAVQNIVSDC